LSGCLEGTFKLFGLWQEARTFIHALKNPLAGLMGALQVICETGMVPEEGEKAETARSLSQEMLGQMKRLDGMIEDYARRVGQILPPNKHAPLERIAERSADELCAQMGTTVQKRLEAGGTECRCNELLLYIAMWDVMRGYEGGVFYLRTSLSADGSIAELSFSRNGWTEKANHSHCQDAASSFERAMAEALGRDGARVFFHGPPGRRSGFTAHFPTTERKQT